MKRTPRKRSAFTLLEVLLVVTLLAILASVVIPAAPARQTPTLKSTVRAFVSDLRTARSLAIQYNAPVVVRFQTEGTYEIAWGDRNRGPLPLGEAAGSSSGSVQRRLNPALVGRFARAPCRFVAIRLEVSGQPVRDLTFTPTGGTGPVRNEDTIIWIGQGTDRDAQYVRIRVSWVTGLVWLDPPTSRAPAAVGFSGTAGNHPRASSAEPAVLIARSVCEPARRSTSHSKERRRT